MIAQEFDAKSFQHITGRVSKEPATSELRWSLSRQPKLPCPNAVEMHFVALPSLNFFGHTAVYLEETSAYLET